jgi:hypothetical protein
LRRLITLGLAGILAACAPVKQEPPPPVAEIKPAPPPRFDSLAVLAQESLPERDSIRDQHRYDRSIGATSIDGLRYYFYQPGGERSVVGFSLLNDGSPKINPVGLKKKGARREYAFLFADRAREDIYLAVNDDVRISGRFSQDNMFRELHFFPRRQLPALHVDHSKGLLEVTLPTGEQVLVDEKTMELAGGALSEAPIDFNKSRYARRNPEIRYQGKYLAITVAQRGEAPRRAKVWGQTKFAEVSYPSKYPKSRCKLSPKFLWDQRPKPGDSDPKLTMLHKTDDQLFDIIERQCHWDLADLRSEPQKLAEASK